MRRDVELIRTTGERAAKLTKQLLAFSRKQVLEPRVLDPNEVITALTPMLRRLIPEHIEFLIAPGREIGRIHADAAQLEQVIVNLVLNARDAMPGGGRLTVETMDVRLDGSCAGRHVGVEPGPYVVVAVVDTGVGMTPDVQAQAFEPFFTTKERGKGTGLGLSTVYGIVKQSGGHVTIQSDVGLGSTFKVYLPRVSDPSARVEDEPPAPEPMRGSETVLLVEDEFDVRTIGREILEDAGYRVLEAGHAEDAIRVAQRHDGPIHAVITDVVMPRSSGPLLVARLIRERPDLRVVYMSGYSDDAVVGDMVVDPGTPFVQKPFTLDTLLRKLREAIDRTG